MDGIEPTQYHCTSYVEDCDPDTATPCKCPVCGGFLSWDKSGEIPICNRCEAELAKLPPKEKWVCCKCETENDGDESCCNCGHDKCGECDDDFDENYEVGKICALSGPKRSLKETVRASRQAKEGAKKWKGWL